MVRRSSGGRVVSVGFDVDVDMVRRRDLGGVDVS